MLQAAAIFLQRQARFLTFRVFPTESTDCLLTARGLCDKQAEQNRGVQVRGTSPPTAVALSPHGECIIVYTDGSCVDNRASGIGIFFGKDHPLNMSKAIKNREHNSCLAEIIAAQTALKTLRNWKLYRDEAVILRTDFLPLVSAMNNSGYNGRFHEDYEVLKDEARKFPKGVEFEHVFGHEGEPGNEAANELARQATAPARAMRSVSVPPSYRFHSGSSNQNRSRSRSRNARSRSRSRSRNRISNDCREHQCRSRSAFVAGGNRSKH